MKENYNNSSESPIRDARSSMKIEESKNFYASENSKNVSSE